MFKKSSLLMVLLMLVLSLALVACSSDDDATENNAAENNNAAEENAGETEGNGNGNAEGGEELPEIEPEEGAELVMWSDGDQQLEWAEAMAEKFEAEYGVPVTVEEVTQEEAPERLATDGPSGLAADVFGSTHDRIGRPISAGLVLENFWPEEYQADFMQGAIDAVTFDGTLYGYPSGIETYALFYNTDLVEEPPATYDELLEVAAGLTEGDQYGFMMTVADFYFQYGFVDAFGGYVFGDGNANVNDIGLNSEGFVKGTQEFMRIKDEVIPGMAAEDITYDVRTSLFGEGKLAFDVNGPWAVPGYNDTGVNFAVAPMPAVNGADYTSFSGTRGFYVNAYTEYPDAASLFAKFLTNEENLLESYQTTGALPPRTALIDNEDIQSEPTTVAFLQQAENATPMPNVPEASLIWDPIHAAYTDIWNNGTDAQEALDKAAETLKSAIEQQQE